MTPRTAALYRERAELQRQLARVDAALADEAEGVAANDSLTETDRRRCLRTLIRILPTLGLHDDARALELRMGRGDVERWLLVYEHGIETLATIAGGLDVAEHLTTPRTEQARDVRLATDALGELNVLLEDERAELERAICGRAA